MSRVFKEFMGTINNVIGFMMFLPMVKLLLELAQSAYILLMELFV